MLTGKCQIGDTACSAVLLRNDMLYMKSENVIVLMQSILVPVARILRSGRPRLRPRPVAGISGEKNIHLQIRKARITVDAAP